MYVYVMCNWAASYRTQKIKSCGCSSILRTILVKLYQKYFSFSIHQNNEDFQTVIFSDSFRLKSKIKGHIYPEKGWSGSPDVHTNVNTEIKWNQFDQSIIVNPPRWTRKHPKSSFFEAVVIESDQAVAKLALAFVHKSGSFSVIGLLLNKAF